jgi:hypothetical protein
MTEEEMSALRLEILASVQQCRSGTEEDIALLLQNLLNESVATRALTEECQAEWMDTMTRSNLK